MIQPDQFDAFYKRSRTRLLLQTFALTGDLPAARSAVRDAFVMTWHHWRKVRRMPDPEAWVRPHAWSRAHRRHTARIWRRDRHLDAETKATLAALGKLSYSQRKALVLAELTDLPPGERSRELGVTRADGDRQLQAATERFLAQREVAPEQVPAQFEALADPVADASWPRASIIRRSGAARRRTHTLVGVVVAVAAVLATGTAVSSAPALDPGPEEEEPPAASTVDEEDVAAASFDASRLLTSENVSAVVHGRRWHETETTDNSGGDGHATLCQQQRYADPDGVAALVRRFETRPGRSEPEQAAVEVAELSADSVSSHEAWSTTTTWYGGCSAPRVQLLATHEVRGVGDEALLFHLRQWGGPSYLVGVARTGLVTTTMLTETSGSPDLGRATTLLGEAVDDLCVDPPGSGCIASDPSTRPTAPVEVGEVPGMLAAVDLPPVHTVDEPWVGTEPRQARDNAAATRCDRTDFSKKPMSNAITRTFLIPEARLPAAFGLTETVGTLPAGKARDFVQTVRNRMKSCPDRDLGSEVVPLAQSSEGQHDLSVWRVTSEVSDDQTVTYLMGVVRDGTAVGQVGFVPGRGAILAPGAFDVLVRRASARLEYMPRPER